MGYAIHHALRISRLACPSPRDLLDPLPLCSRSSQQAKPTQLWSTRYALHHRSPSILCKRPSHAEMVHPVLPVVPRLTSSCHAPRVSQRTKKAGITGKYGVRYGASLRKGVKKMEISQHAKYTCVFCGKDSVKRHSVGIWHCAGCGKTSAGGAYTLNTAQAAQVRPFFFASPHGPRRVSEPFELHHPSRAFAASSRALSLQCWPSMPAPYHPLPRSLLQRPKTSSDATRCAPRTGALDNPPLA